MTWNMITGLVATLIGAAYGWSAWNLPRATFGNPTGHIVYPAILGALMTLLGLALVVKELLSKSPSKAKNSPKFGALTRHGKEIAIAIAASLCYALLFEPLGYVIATILYLGAVLFLVNGRVKVARTVIVAVAFSVGVYVLFSVLLGIQLPRMPILDI
ncbi:MAG: tripartite tricarboxylate transporter TctB family protein [Spirochaetes bacterium]|nr:tripartite tricarboxylate transporter TctB family protein [Spirochaetota bacterium]MBU1082361.1 tripartite tricarboxylate transporter TctB family protein [Spirochaetota bacterium]